MKIIKKIFNEFLYFLLRIREDHVSSFAAQSSFFLIISIFPLLLLILNTIKYTPVTKSFLLQLATDIFPRAFDPLIITVIDEMYSNSSGTIISITAILAIWSASKGIMGLIRGLNFIYHIKEKRNYFIVRFVASVYTIILVAGIAVSLVLLVFGNYFLKALEPAAPFIYRIIYVLSTSKYIYVPIFLTLIFVLLYKIVPYEKLSISYLLPGAVFSSIGWILFSFAFSIYVDHFANSSYMYGSLTTVVLLMLWMYFEIYIVFLGAEINLYLIERPIDIEISIK